MLAKLKIHQEVIFLSVAIVLVGLIGFGLGRLSSKYQTADLKIKSTLTNVTNVNKIVTDDYSIPMTQTAQNESPGAAQNIETTGREVREVAAQKVVGNKSSKIYHYENCPGALRMKEENKIYFVSILEAQGAGYKPAGNCLGLK